MQIKTTKYIQIGIVLLCIISFFPGFNADFINYDDPEYVINNKYIQHFSWENIKQIFSGKPTVLYVPLTLFSYLVEYSLFGLNPKTFHFFNVVLHILNALMLFKILLKLKIRNNYLIYTVLLFFAINPLVTESVCWITERKDMLYCLFYFLAILQFLNYYETKHLKNGLLCFLFFSLSCLSKPMAVSLPVLFLLFLFYTEQKAGLKKLRFLLPFFIISFLFSIISIYEIKNKTSAGDLNLKYSLSEKITLFFSELGYYFFKPFLPIRQQLIHSFPLNNGIYSNPALILFSVLGACALCFLIYKGFKNKLFLFLTLAWLVFLLPVLQIYANTHAYVSERYFYVSIIFPAIFLFLFLNWLKLSDKVWQAGLVLIMIIFTTLTFKRSKFWNNTQTLFEQELKMDKNDTYALNNLGYYYNTRSEFVKASVLLKEAVHLDTTNSIFLNNYGWAIGAMGQTDSAMTCFNKALAHNKDDIGALNNLGISYMKKNDPTNALRYFNKAYELNPENNETLYNLGAYYLKIGEKEKARPLIRKAVELGNKSAIKYLNY